MAKLFMGKQLWTIRVLGVLVLASFFLGSPAHAKVFDVKNYGAKGDAASDDAAPIQLAINAAGNSPGTNTVFFPDGFYRIGNSVSTPTLTVSKSMTILGGQNAFLFMVGPDQQLLVNAPQVTVNSLIIENQGSNKNSAVLLKGANGSSVKNCTITDWTNGVTVRNSTGTTVDNTTVYSPKRETGVLVQNNSGVTITNSNFNSKSAGFGYGVFSDASNNAITIKNCHFDKLGYAVYVLGNGLASAVGSIKGSNNTFDDCYYGYYCDSVGTLTIDSETINNSTTAIFGQSTITMSVTGCTIKAPFTYGVYAVKSKNPIQISSNTMTKLGGTYGINVGGAATITNNTLTGLGFSALGIYTSDSQSGPGASNVKITDNTISGVLYGVESNSLNSLTVKNNHISNTQACGIYTLSDTMDSISNNDLKNCALSLSSSYAVIYVNGFSNGNVSYTVTDNTYTAQQTANLTYFVYVHGGHATVKNNKTNTMLPSFP